MRELKHNLITRAAGELPHTALCAATGSGFQAGVSALHVLPPSYLAVIIVFGLSPVRVRAFDADSLKVCREAKSFWSPEKSLR